MTCRICGVTPDDPAEDDLDGTERAELARQADAALALLTRVDAAGVE